MKGRLVGRQDGGHQRPPGKHGPPWSIRHRFTCAQTPVEWRQRCAVRERRTPGRECDSASLGHERLAAAQVRQPSGGERRSHP